MPLKLEDIHGRILDIDSHERVPFARWGQVFGERAERFRQLSQRVRWDESLGVEDPDEPGMNLTVDSQDILDITPQTVWVKKGTPAPSAVNLNRRPEVLDMMGIHRALVMPGMGLIALVEAMGGARALTSEEEKEAAWGAVEAHNEWAGEFTCKFPDRLRVVGMVAGSGPSVTVASLLEETERLLNMGVKAILITVNLPTAGLSPADPALDPFYATLADANVPLITHPPSGLNYVQQAWHLLGGLASGGLAAFHLGSENYIRILTLGGVFERHPNLRFGAIEQGSTWIGQLAETMDLIVEGDLPASSSGLPDPGLSMLPSEYLNRNVRVTPWNFEPVERWFDRYPQIQNCYCFSTDYPHVEGREWALQKYYQQLAPLGDEIVEKFFCANSQLLLP